MALACTNLTNGSSITDGTSYATASVTPTSNALVLLSVTLRRSAGTPTTPTVSGCGLTWVEVVSQASSGGANRKISIFRAMGSSPSSGAITITCSETQTEASWSVDQFTGTDTSGTNGSGAIVQSGSSNDGGVAATSCTLTLSAFGSTANMAYGAKTTTANVATTPGSGFTELSDVQTSESGTGFQTQYKVNDNTIDWSWTGSNSWFCAGCEVKEAVAVVGSVYPRFYAIEHRSRSGTLKNRWENCVSDLSWEFLARGGCGVCEFTITGTYTSYTIEADDDIRIWLNDPTLTTTGKLVYRGYIKQWERFIGQDEKIAITCDGYFSKFRRYLVNDDGEPKAYESQAIEIIVDDIVDTFVVANTTPAISIGTIDASNFSPDYIEFKQSAADALDVLASLLNNVEYGVDENLEFYWRTESLTVSKRFYLGKDIEEYSELTETENVVNKLYFEGNTQNDVVFTSTGQSSSSQTVYGLREAVVSNSSINTTAPATQIMNAMFLENNRPKVKINVRIPHQTYRFEDSIPMGTVQIINTSTNQLRNKWGKTASSGSNLIWGKTSASGSGALWGGVPYHLINRIKYTLSTVDGYMNYDLEIGGSRYDTPAIINQIEHNLNAVRQRQI